VIGLISDAHGHVEAFERGLQVLTALGASSVYFLGDAVGYIPSPGVLERLAEPGSPIVCLLGNHDQMLISDSRDTSGEQVYQLEPVRRVVSEQARDRLSSWPSYLVVESASRQIAMMHGSPSDPVSGYVYPDTDLAQFEADTDFVVMAHTHRPFVRRLGTTTFLNVGSCGLPRDDGRFGAVATLDLDRDSASVYRFSIEDMNLRLLSSGVPLHSSVVDLFGRRADAMYGEIVDPS
jgi:putative phosphoesterase